MYRHVNIIGSWINNQSINITVLFRCHFGVHLSWIRFPFFRTAWPLRPSADPGPAAGPTSTPLVSHHEEGDRESQQSEELQPERETGQLQTCLQPVHEGRQVQSHAEPESHERDGVESKAAYQGDAGTQERYKLSNGKQCSTLLIRTEQFQSLFRFACGESIHTLLAKLWPVTTKTSCGIFKGNIKKNFFCLKNQ